MDSLKLHIEFTRKHLEHALREIKRAEALDDYCYGHLTQVLDLELKAINHTAKAKSRCVMVFSHDILTSLSQPFSQKGGD